ncbi:FKBP-type peptidyl-prolyl cis-trans isomerase [Arsukibacterium sp.]|uniref:FKBP-type peptidyl-prolyl cis-trans isomerase n=1 Tax=Arsukibacterium sp. TaxID=1977258 RepID=UPI002FDA706E
MKISNNAVVQFHYSLSDETGELENSAGSTPLLYMHGQQQMLPKLEAALEGKTEGDSLELTLAPADAYGELKADAIQSIQVKYLHGAKKWKPGMKAWVQTDDGQRQVTVVKVGMFKADIDTNHPLAGKTLTFNINILKVREASAEEIAHGHAHGEGGHQH